MVTISRTFYTSIYCVLSGIYFWKCGAQRDTNSALVVLQSAKTQEINSELKEKVKLCVLLILNSLICICNFYHAEEMHEKEQEKNHQLSILSFNWGIFFVNFKNISWIQRQKLVNNFQNKIISLIFPNIRFQILAQNFLLLIVMYFRLLQVFNEPHVSGRLNTNFTRTILVAR